MGPQQSRGLCTHCNTNNHSSPHCLHFLVCRKAALLISKHVLGDNHPQRELPGGQQLLGLLKASTGVYTVSQAPNCLRLKRGGLIHPVCRWQSAGGNLGTCIRFGSPGVRDILKDGAEGMQALPANLALSSPKGQAALRAKEEQESLHVSAHPHQLPC